MDETEFGRLRYLFVQKWTYRLRSLWSIFFERVIREPLWVPENGPLIIASNHKTMLDHWLITLAFNSRTFANRLPMRFLAHHPRHFPKFGRPVVKLVWWLYGVTSIEKGAVRKLASLLDTHGGTALVYPEGRRTEGDEIISFQRGVIDLARQTKTPVLLCAIRFGSWRRFPWNGRTKCVINFAQTPLYIPEEYTGWKEAAEFLKDEVAYLYEEAGQYL